MLREIENVRQEPKAPGRRRWFEAGGFDLVVWYSSDGAVVGFQLCYQTLHGEFALTWRDGVGFAHDAVDEGDTGPTKNLTPILMPKANAPWEMLARTFGERSAALEPALRSLVADKLAERTRKA